MRINKMSFLGRLEIMFHDCLPGDILEQFIVFGLTFIWATTFSRAIASVEFCNQNPSQSYTIDYSSY